MLLVLLVPLALAVHRELLVPLAQREPLVPELMALRALRALRVPQEPQALAPQVQLVLRAVVVQAATATPTWQAISAAT